MRIAKNIGAIGLPVMFGAISVATFAMAWSANTSAAPIAAPSVLRSSATTTTAAPTTTLAPTTTSSTTTTSTTTTTEAPTTTAPPPPPPPPPTTVKKRVAAAKPAAAPAPAPAPAPAGAVTEVGGVAGQCIALTNNERTSNGLPPLAYNGMLQAAAQGQSDYQAATQTMSHTGAGGSTPGARISAAGYGWHAYGENVAAGQGSCAAVVSAWMASPGHRANILNATFVHIGVALAKDANGRPYWTMDLAAP